MMNRMGVNTTMHKRLGKVCLLRALFALFLLACVVHAEDAPVPADSAQVDSAAVAAPADSAQVDSTAADTSQAAPEELSSGGWKRIFYWPFEHIVQPVLNGVVYPIAAPIRYALRL